MRLFKKLSLFILGALLLLVPLKLANAQSASEQIDSFTSNIAVSSQNVATITETIEYNFGSLDRHGIKRFVPIKTKAAGSNQSYYYDFKFIGASVDGHSVESKVSSEGNYKLIRLGDPNRTITGIHSYNITYQISPVVEQDSQGDYLNWNITGNDWEVPILSASANILLPHNSDVTNSRCYTGSTGSTSQDCQISASANQISVAGNGVIGSGEGLTINVLMSPGGFSVYLAPGNPPAYQWLPAVGFIVGIVAILLGLLGRLLSWLLYRYRRGRELVIAQYEAPDGLSPGEIGLLNDNRTNMVEITATLVDLAVRGYMRIEQTKPKSVFKKAEYKFHGGRSYKSGVSAYERSLLDLLFNSGSRKSIALKSISANKASTVISGIKTTLKKNLESKGYYELTRKKGLLKKLRKLLTWLIILAVIMLNIYSWAKGASLGICIFSAAAMLFGILMGWVFAQRTELSQAGYKQWAEVQGLKLFLTVTEKQRLKFHDAPEKNPKLFNKLLPYAIALGVEKQWAKQFEGMDVTEDSGWYNSRYPFTPIVLADSMSHDLAQGVSSSFTPTQSSGGYSGGGFSGGGGGGGGSW